MAVAIYSKPNQCADYSSFNNTGTIIAMVEGIGEEGSAKILPRVKEGAMIDRLSV